MRCTKRGETADPGIFRKSWDLKLFSSRFGTFLKVCIRWYKWRLQNNMHLFHDTTEICVLNFVFSQFWIFLNFRTDFVCILWIFLVKDFFAFSYKMKLYISLRWTHANVFQRMSDFFRDLIFHSRLRGKMLFTFLCFLNYAYWWSAS